MSGRFLVTGGAGFIGSALCRHLRGAGQDVVVLDDLSSGRAERLAAGVRLIEADIGDPAALRAALDGVDGVFHLAAISSVEACRADPAGTRRTNLGGTVALLDAAAGRPVVHASSAAVYGDQTAFPIAETATPRPISAYAADKLASENCVEQAAERGERTAVLRLFNVYGPGQPSGSPYAGVIARFAAQAALGHALTVRGDGSQVRDFVHLDDAVAAFAIAMAHILAMPSGTFIRTNVCTGQPVTVLELARSLSRLADTGAPVVFAPPRAGDIHRSVGDPAHACAVLGLAPGRPLHTGLRDLLGAFPRASSEVHLREAHR